MSRWDYWEPPEPYVAGGGEIRSHGAGGYNKGCRCEVCTRASRERQRRYRARIRADRQRSAA